MDASPHLTGKFVWFEHVSADMQKARAFYQPLFGWHVETMPRGERRYPMILNGEAGIGSLRQASPGEPPHWASYLSVPDVDASFRAAVAAGATPLHEPADVAPSGRGGALRDPTGAAFWLWTSRNGDAPDPTDLPTGDFCWNELWTPNPEKALAFYEAVFGYDRQTLSAGAATGADYHQLKSPDGKARAGVLRLPGPQVPPMWLPYVAVADCDATVQQARQLGARDVPMPPTDIPQVGRIAVLIDPLGAGLAVIKPTPMAG